MFAAPVGSFFGDDLGRNASQRLLELPTGDTAQVLRAATGGTLSRGRASPDVLDRIARALMLTDVAREHLFLLGLGRPPGVCQRR